MTERDHHWPRDVWIDIETGEWGLMANLRALQQTDLPLNLGVATPEELRCRGLDYGLPVTAPTEPQPEHEGEAPEDVRPRREVTAARIGQQSPGQAYVEGLREGGDLLLANLWGRVVAATDPGRRQSLLDLHEQLRTFHKAVTGGDATPSNTG